MRAPPAAVASASTTQLPARAVVSDAYSTTLAASVCATATAHACKTKTRITATLLTWNKTPLWLGNSEIIDGKNTRCDRISGSRADAYFESHATQLHAAVPCLLEPHRPTTGHVCITGACRRSLKYHIAGDRIMADPQKLHACSVVSKRHDDVCRGTSNDSLQLHVSAHDDEAVQIRCR